MVFSMPVFLAHAVALEAESAVTYRTLADAMETHNNQEVAALFRRMADFSSEHEAEALRRAEGNDLPRLKSWEYAWGKDDGPESWAIAEAHYLMTPHHALTAAVAAEQRGLDFYADVGRTAEDPAVCALAEAYVAEETLHVAALKEWLAKHPSPKAGWNDDPDPPNCVE